jgi:hypothetical protein
MAKTIKAAIAAPLREEDIAICLDRQSKACMILVIDEIGIAKDAKYVGTKPLLNDLTVSLQKMVANVQLVVTITSSVNSNKDAIKIRMAPWALDQIMWLANQSKNVQWKTVAQTIRDTPIFLQLRSNARAAWFLLEAVTKHGDYWENVALIDAVVKDAAFRYIKANGLARCDAERRRRIAKIAKTLLLGLQAHQWISKYVLGMGWRRR